MRTSICKKLWLLLIVTCSIFNQLSAQCTGTPIAGSISTPTTFVCPGTPALLTLNGASGGTGIGYQWQSSTNGSTWSNIANATSDTYNYTPGTNFAGLYIRVAVTCSNSNITVNADPVKLTLPAIQNYVSLPFTEDFELDWIHICADGQLPTPKMGMAWNNLPATGNSSWRRDDNGDGASWSQQDFGAYSPGGAEASDHSARFHSTYGTKGMMDLYLNCSGGTSAVKKLFFDYNNADGTDSMEVVMSTDAGNTFKHIGTAYTAASWTLKSMYFSSTSATTIIRFIATADNNNSDIGLDNVAVKEVDACTGTPTIPNALASDNNVCKGLLFSLSLSETADNKEGLLYQWQSSTDHTTWNDMQGATDSIFIASESATTYYRAVITCIGSGQTVTTNEVMVAAASEPLNGAYTINSAAVTGARNFSSFAEVARVLHCAGVSGPVTIDVKAGNGPYNEQLILGNTEGMSATNTVTFNGNGNTIYFSSQDPNEQAVVKLRDADHYRFNNLVIDARPLNTSGLGTAVQLMNNADSNSFIGCHIIADTSFNMGGYKYAVVISGTDNGVASNVAALCDSNYFDSNIIMGGYSAIAMQSNKEGTCYNNVFTRNTISEFNYKGFQIYGATNTLIDSNAISCPVRKNTSNFAGVYLEGGCTNTIVSRNTFTCPDDGLTHDNYLSYWGIFDGGNDWKDEGTVMVNNLMHHIGMGAYITGILMSNTTAKVYHNTIDIDYPGRMSSGIVNGILVTNDIYNEEIQDNLVTIHNNSTIRAAGAVSIQESINADYNNYYLTGTGNNFIGVVGTTNAATIDDWKTATGAEEHSISMDPAYTDAVSGNYIPTSKLFDNRGTGLGVAFDIRNMLRRTDRPDMGAFEFSACSPLRGLYTIDYSAAPGTARTFVSFNDAYAALSCGIDSAVVFNVVPSSHVYNEQLNMGAIDGSSVLNTVTFRGNGDTLRYSSANTNHRAVMEFNSTKHFIIDSLVIDATAPDAQFRNRWGYGIQFMRDADSNRIHKCTVISDTSFGHAGNFAAFDYHYNGIMIGANIDDNGDFDGNDGLSDYLTIDSSKFMGGNAGIWMKGGSSYDSIYHNEVTNFASSGIALVYDYYALTPVYNTNFYIYENEIHHQTPTTFNTANGISVIGANNVFISKNRVHHMKALANNGIIVTALNDNPDSKAIFTNNIMYEFGMENMPPGPQSHSFGISSNAAGYVLMAHNTISIKNTNTGKYGLIYGISNAVLGSPAHTIIENNVISIYGDSKEGASACINVFKEVPGVIFTIDHNDYYTKDNANNKVGNYGGVYSDSLSQWIVNTKFDSSSVSMDPMFTDAATGNLKPTNGKMDNLGVPLGITDDIIYVSRSMTKPDIGAYEFNVCPSNFASFKMSNSQPCIGEMVLFTSIDSIPDQKPVTKWEWDLANNTTANQSTASASYATEGSYNIKLTASTAAGCVDDTIQVVKVTNCDKELFVPNAFTPNNDGQNDVIQVYGNGIKEMHFMVFNQWGEKLVESTNPSMAWDGKQGGKLQPSGVYMYVCKVVLTSGKEVVKKGVINLIR